MIPEPQEIHISTRHIAGTAPIGSGCVLGIRTLLKVGGTIPLPLTILAVAVGKSETVSATIIRGWDIRPTEAAGSYLHIAVIEGPHRFIAENPKVDRGRTGYIAHSGVCSPHSNTSVDVSPECRFHIFR